MIVRRTNVLGALRRRQRGFIIDPFRFGAAAAASTWNPSDKDADVTLSGGDLIATVNNAAGSVRSITGRDAAGDWYFEVEATTQPDSGLVGIGASGASLAVRPGFAATSYGFLRRDNTIYNNGSTPGGVYLAAASVVGILVDFTAGTITIRRAGKFYTNSFSSVSGTLYPMWGSATGGGGSRVGTINTGGSTFALGLPIGATAWGGTWNSADKAAAITLSGSDLIATATASTGAVRGTQGRSSGRYYFEVTESGADQTTGVGNSSAVLTGSYPGSAASGTNSWAYYSAIDQRWTNGATAPTAMPAQMSAVVIGVWLKAGALKFVGDGHVGGNAYTGLSGTYYGMWGADTLVTMTGTANFAGPFNWQPAGSTAWG